MGHILDFLKSLSKNVLKLILKSSTFVPFGANLTDFGAKPTIPEITDYSANVVYFRIDGNQLTEHEKLLLLSMGVTFIL